MHSHPPSAHPPGRPRPSRLTPRPCPSQTRPCRCALDPESAQSGFGFAVLHKKSQSAIPLDHEPASRLTEGFHLREPALDLAVPHELRPGPALLSLGLLKLFLDRPVAVEPHAKPAAGLWVGSRQERDRLEAREGRFAGRRGCRCWGKGQEELGSRSLISARRARAGSSPPRSASRWRGEACVGTGEIEEDAARKSTHHRHRSQNSTTTRGSSSPELSWLRFGGTKVEMSRIGSTGDGLVVGVPSVGAHSTQSGADIGEASTSCGANSAASQRPQ